MLSRMTDPARDEVQNRKDDDVIAELIESSHGPLSLPKKQLAHRMCEAYFEFIHPQYPILHHATTITALDHMYENGTVPPIISFQVFMVLALGATALSMRSKARLPADSYCAAALQYFSQINIENSLQGLQCLLLLLIFALHCPSTRFNLWYLNYQCLAAVLDLGLQRNITVSSGISLLEQEMRTRVFWVCMLLDRTICTIMGRPIGLRDEACELRVSSHDPGTRQTLTTPSCRKRLKMKIYSRLARQLLWLAGGSGSRTRCIYSAPQRSTRK